MKNILLSTLTCFLLTSLVMAQDTHQLHGVVTDSRSAAVSTATVLLLAAADSAIVKTSVTDKEGAFAFNSISSGSYIIKVTCVGFAAWEKAVEVSSTQGDVLVNISVANEAKELGGITITAQRPLIEAKVDRLVMNVSSSVLGNGYNALDVLAKAPGVFVDPRTESISLNGKGGTTVFIDGKKTYLSSGDLAVYLKGMQSTEIEKIEIIANPGAKYDAEGTAGIINIITKKNRQNGTTGTINMAGALVEGGRGRASGGFNVNRKQGKVILYAGYSFSERGSLSTDQAELDYLDPQTGQITNKHLIASNISGNSVSHTYRAGLDWNIDRKTTFSVLLKGNNYSSVNNTFSQTNLISGSAIPDSLLYNNTSQRSQSSQYSADLGVTHYFDAAKTRLLSVDFNYSSYQSHAHGNIDNYYFVMDSAKYTDGITLRNSLPTNIKIAVGTIDYEQPLWKGKVEMGLKSSIVSTDNNAQYEQFNGGEWINDSANSNDFNYKENINAAYLDYGATTKGGLDYKVGVRAEQTNSTGDLVTTGEKNTRSYLDIFPTLSLHKKLGHEQDLSLAYGRRINRPSYQDLNPFIYFVDIYTYTQGNPFLQSEYSNNLDLTYMLKGKYVVSTGYSRTDHSISYVTERLPSDPSIIRTQSQNLNDLSQAYLNFSIPVRITKWWNLDNELDGTYLKYGISNIPGATVNNSGAYAVLDVSSYFTLPHGWKPEVDGYFYTPHPDGIATVKASYNISAGLQKSFAGKWRLRAAYNDIFRSARYNSLSVLDNFSLKNAYRWDSNFFQLSLSYNFGNQNVKATSNKTTIAGDEQGRIK